MKKLFMLLRSLIKRGYVTRVSQDNGFYPVVQVSYLGKVGDAEYIMPYGYNCNFPVNTPVAIWNLQAYENNRVCMPFLEGDRFKNLAVGEVKVGSPPTGSYVYFKSDGVYADIKYLDGFHCKKISDTIVPLHKAVLFSFWNPVLRFFRTKIDIYENYKKHFNFGGILKRFSFFDGGLVNNYAGATIYKNIPYVQFSCGNIPEKRMDWKGLLNTSNWIYNTKRGDKEFIFKYTGAKAFFAFWDSNVEEEYNKPETNFFPEWE